MAATPRQVQLNKQIVQCRSYEDVLSIARDQLKDFNLVNCTTALQRLAKSQGGPGRPRGGKGLGELKPLLVRTAGLAKEWGKRCPAQNIANALWACERLGAAACPETVTIAEVARAAVADPRQLAKFSGQNLANTAWAAAKLGGPVAKDFAAFSKAIGERAKDLNGQELSMAAWALASTGESGGGGIEAVASAARALPGGGVWALSSQQLATVAWALARLACRDTSLLAEIAQAAPARVAAGEFNEQDLANAAWAFGRLEVPAEKLFAEVSRCLIDKLSGSRKRKHNDHSFSAQHLSMMAWAFAKLGVKETAAVPAIAEEARQRLGEFAARDLADVVWAVAQTGARAPEFVEAAGAAARARLSDFNSQELLRFLGAFRRAGGDAGIQSEIASVQRDLTYTFPALDSLEVALTAETPGGGGKKSRRGLRKDAATSGEQGGDPQRADGGTTGVSVWEASFVLAEWLSRQGRGLSRCRELAEALPPGARRWKRWRGKVGVELGAGLGLPSIVAAHLGARVVATDGDPAVLRLLRRNAERNAPGAGAPRLRAEALLWGADNTLQLLGLERPPDFVLAADVVYASGREELTQQLTATLLALSGPETLVLVSNVRRFPEGHPKGEGRFFASLERFFEHALLPQWCLHADFRRVGVGGCALHALRRRPAAPAPAPAGPEGPKARRKRRRSPGLAPAPASPPPAAAAGRRRAGAAVAGGAGELPGGAEAPKRTRRRRCSADSDRPRAVAVPVAGPPGPAGKRAKKKKKLGTRRIGASMG